VFHVRGGIGGIAETLVEKIDALGGRVLYRQHVERIIVRDGRAIRVQTRHNRREEQFPCDIVLANLVPWSLDDLLGDDSPPKLRRETQTRRFGWGAFALNLGLRADTLPPNLPDHHQIIASMQGALGETRSVFISLSPLWDETRAPAGQRAATVTTHTDVQQWWDLPDEAAYEAKKAEYTDAILTNIERAIPGFRAAVTLTMPGTPVTYQFYTGRHKGMVGGFPQTSLFKARNPATGVANVRLIGDSIFPGQSTAGVTLGAMRVAADVLRHLPRRATFSLGAGHTLTDSH
jgi:phytoene dehydrogenase-like protein